MNTETVTCPHCKTLQSVVNGRIVDHDEWSPIKVPNGTYRSCPASGHPAPEQIHSIERCENCGEPALHINGKIQSHEVPGLKTVSGNTWTCTGMPAPDAPEPKWQTLGVGDVRQEGYVIEQVKTGKRIDGPAFRVGEPITEEDMHSDLGEWIYLNPIKPKGGETCATTNLSVKSALANAPTANSTIPAAQSTEPVASNAAEPSNPTRAAEEPFIRFLELFAKELEHHNPIAITPASLSSAIKQTIHEYQR